MDKNSKKSSGNFIIDSMNKVPMKMKYTLGKALDDLTTLDKPKIS